MENNTTVIKDPSAPEMEPKRFTFDFSYWSHDDFTERDDGYLAPNSPRYADQVSLDDCTTKIYLAVGVHLRRCVHDPEIL
jgi:hypothetical protein